MSISPFYHPVDVPHSGKVSFTDYSRWRLSFSENGDHRWKYLKTDEESEAWPQTDVDKYWLGLPLDNPLPPPATDALSSARNGLQYLKNLQSDDGHWAGEYGGPMFLLPGLVIGSYVTGMPLREEERMEIIRYLINLAHKEDGGWGLHIEGPSTVFGTALNYCVLRILGVSAEHPTCAKARATLHKLGGATGAPSWGKFWMSVLNVYSWDGCNAISPELCALGVYEQCAFPPLRRMALNEAYKLICMEDENTNYQGLAPVSKVMNMVVRTIVDGRESEAYREHMRTRDDFLWIGPEGMRMTGTNGSQLWDIAFITQALVESGLGEEADGRQCLIGSLKWLERNQIRENPKHYKRTYRHATKGAWPFSTKTQGYTVSDCVGEGLKAVLYIQGHVKDAPQLISERRLCDAVDVIISLQNPDGGFASYELIRGYNWFEYLNPAEIFGDIMTEHNYPECTTSSITALAIFRKQYPHYRKSEIDRCIRRAVEWLHVCQKPEGGWYGSWGICFTYATQFALESLSLVGETYATSDAARRACHFLISKQREDGGWGESWKSCEDIKYVEHEKTQVVQTAWAAMALIYAGYPEPGPIERAVKLVMSRQRPDGSWPQESLEGIFNKTVTIAYPLFKFSFTIWMLGRAHQYLAKLRKQG
ncbi:hypothetical protein EUX98_g4663 [Antrodiella citrinella]|uniref:Terpene cyclase/mutase family member n=1 Tax=Antrodiella citrinella TaxID=2447956 RepID=A0A4S4MTF1_9APHY|nr:hypothetical protein EUX98_g4663 [Antrodiella citrinella]